MIYTVNNITDLLKSLINKYHVCAINISFFVEGIESNHSDLAENYVCEKKLCNRFTFLLQYNVHYVYHYYAI